MSEAACEVSQYQCVVQGLYALAIDISICMSRRMQLYCKFESFKFNGYSLDISEGAKIHNQRIMYVGIVEILRGIVKTL